MATLRQMLKAEHEARAREVGKAEYDAKYNPSEGDTQRIVRLYNRLDSAREALDNLTHHKATK